VISYFYNDEVYRFSQLFYIYCCNAKSVLWHHCNSRINRVTSLVILGARTLAMMFPAFSLKVFIASKCPRVHSWSSDVCWHTL